MDLDFCFTSSIFEIDGEEWNRLVLAASGIPMLAWEWFATFESTGLTAPGGDFSPEHLVVRSNGEIVAIAPLFRKKTPEAEWTLAGLYDDLNEKLHLPQERLVGLIPYAPVAGYRLLVGTIPRRREVF